MILIYGDLSEKKKKNDEEEEISSAEEDLLWYTRSEWKGEVNIPSLRQYSITSTKNLYWCHTTSSCLGETTPPSGVARLDWIWPHLTNLPPILR